MPKYQTRAQHDLRCETIAKAEGEECIVCHFEHFVPRRSSVQVANDVKRSPKKLEIDHADGDRTNWALSNLHLVCHKHNCILRNMTPRQHYTLMRSYSDQLERERERENLTTWKTVLKEQVPYESGSPEMQANRNYENKWLRYAHQCLQDSGSIRKDDLITGGSAFSNCSIQTSRNYLAKYTSPISVFREARDNDGDKIIVFREPITRFFPPSMSKASSNKPANLSDGNNASVQPKDCKRR